MIYAVVLLEILCLLLLVIATWFAVLIYRTAKSIRREMPLLVYTAAKMHLDARRPTEQHYDS